MSRSLPAAPAPRSVLGAAAADLVAVVVFAAVGRASHSEDVFGPGLAVTAWPFLAGLGAGWVASLAWRRPLAPIRSGVPIWLVTVLGGMLLRGLSGQGVQLAFVIVATIVLGLFLVGWRGLFTVIRHRRRRG